MFETFLRAMEQKSATRLEKTGSASALWFNEWAKLGLRAYDPGNKVVFTSAYSFPMEIVEAFDAVPFDFELAAGTMTAGPLGVPAMSEAEDRGYSMDTCSFHRAALGASYLDYFPKPDALITTSYYCDGKVKTNEILAAASGVGSLLLHVPAAVTAESVAYVSKQLREITRAVGEAIGQKPDHDRLKAAVRSSNRARKSQLRMLELLKHCPAPWGGSQLVGFSINSQLFTGNEIRERLHDAFASEMERKIEEGGGRPERHRLYWFAWIPTYRSEVFEILEQRQISVPLCETFRLCWDEIDEDNPFEGLALRCLNNPFVGPGRRRTDCLESIVEDYGIDGAILFATPACRQSISGYVLLKEALGKLGLPLLVLDMDIGDSRSYMRGQIRTRLEAFAELLDG